MERCYCEGQGPQLMLKGGRKPSPGDRGTPHPPTSAPRSPRPRAHLREAGRGLWSLPGGGADGAAGLAVCRAVAQTRSRFGLGALWPDLPRELPGTATRNRPEALGSSSFCFWFGLLMFSGLKRLPWCALDNGDGAAEVGAPAGTAGALRVQRGA